MSSPNPDAEPRADTDANSEATAAVPPRTGDRSIDDALDEVHQLEELPVADHHEVLSPAHDQLQQALHRDHSLPADGRG